MKHMIAWFGAGLVLATLSFLKAHAMGGNVQPSEPRLALVINQSDYQGNLSDLSGTPQEAAQIEAALIQTGFEVWREENLTTRALKTVLREFRRALDAAGPQAVGFVYYTGHGAQHPASKLSYLLGIDADLEVASDLTEFGVSLTDQRDNFAAVSAKAIFMVFDACRNVPGFGEFKTSVKGLAPVTAKSDMLIAYSTALGDVAKEGEYAPILAEELVRPGQSAETAFSNTQRRVATRTNRQQLPWFNPQIYNTVCFAGCGGPNFTEVGDLVQAMGGREQRQQTVVSDHEGEETSASSSGFCQSIYEVQDTMAQRPGDLVRLLKSSSGSMMSFEVNKQVEGFNSCELVRFRSASDEGSFDHRYNCVTGDLTSIEATRLFMQLQAELVACSRADRFSQRLEVVNDDPQFGISFRASGGELQVDLVHRRDDSSDYLVLRTYE